MHFDFEDRLFDIPTIEPAMSWRERALLSLFAHVIFVLLLVFGAQLPFVRDAAERRAERLAVLLAEQTAVNPACVTYLNRLSDWFFVAARMANNAGKEDVLWVPGANRA